MLSQQEICFITHQVGMMFYMFLRSHELLTEREELPVCIVFPRNSFFDLFPVHFRQSVIMVIARLFTGQAHYCVLCYGRPSWMSFKSTQWEGNSLEGSGKNNWKEIFLASLPRLRQNFDARPLCTYMKPRCPHVPRR